MFMASSSRNALSLEAKTLWAKSSENGDWLPLRIHMADAAGIALKLWENWLPCGPRSFLAGGMTRLAVFLAAAHDAGKATPAFQAKNDALQSGLAQLGLHFTPLLNPSEVPHALASQAILRRYGFAASIAVVAGGHHGAPPDSVAVKNCKGRDGHTGFNDSAWIAVQDELVQYAAELAGADPVALRYVTLSVPEQALFSGLVIVADWLASDENLFPYISPGCFDSSEAPEERVNRVWEKLRLLPQWDIVCDGLMSTDIFLRRFAGRCTALRPLQQFVVDAFPNIEQPGIAVIEAPMGEGKTEAALAVAEIFAGKTGRGGVFFALPTQATSDGLFPRLLEWMRNIERVDGAYTLQLAHGKSRFNEDYRGLPVERARVGGYGEDEDDGGVAAHEWFSGRKKSMLAGFVVGTVDQVLLAGLRQKHLALRHLGLANKVVVIDECHAYDAYMSQYLHKALRWLGAYGVPVIILSATLTGEKRREVVQAYLGGGHAAKEDELEWAACRAYPLITYTDGGEVRQSRVDAAGRGLSVQLRALADEELPDRVEALLAGGGCAGIIVNTVKRAQTLWRVFSERMGSEHVRLLHSRFLAGDRVEKEAELRRMLGRPEESERPEKLVVIGTQVMEQSLDVDFDVLFSDLAPMDLLIQRIGRLHRHGRPRPEWLGEPRCFLLGLEDGEVFDSSAKVYGEWPLLSAREILRENAVLCLPDDIAEWINRAYVREDGRFADARAKHDARIEQQKNRAKTFQIFDPCDNLGDLTGWLSLDVMDDATGKKGEATVRDTDPSLEVIVVEQDSDGVLRMLSWVEAGAALPARELPDELAANVAACTVTLPRSLSAPWNIGKTIDELESGNRKRIPAAWQRSPWLRGELFLVMTREEEELAARLGGYRLVYDREYGLVAAREGYGA